ncbi:tRNA glutamyl-Q(34) synthetase GluQRS [Collinsella tanakaei]|uniref:tRNA glutamyl-Q(34) synthetase GluQRS n=1 Tax=Collinsella tanakaei TaxID=626935 RepID=UPI001957D35E|nr:tRNA glutamyl-Q(34) synthetase GluQRS [Collinsella tanakaei]MBM6755026.1 tRNA glutamyl-Q(34) synthetase GluQRS [Collinsella tanakaei]
MNADNQDTSAAHADVVGRFAPSPSGRMHLGNIFSALIAWLSVRAANGRMVLRIEDLDPRCADPERAEQIMADLHWLGLDWDEGPIYQHDRLEIYRTAVAALQDRGLVYPCFCSRAELHAASAPHASDGTPVYAGTCRNLTPDEIAEKSRVRPAALRLRVPEANDPAGTIAFSDRVFGDRSETLARDCGDFLIRRSDGVFAYQLVVVVDDAAMGVTEVVRGRDLLSSAPRQIYLQRLLGYPEPAYAHVPMLIAPDGRRLSKREHDCDMGELKRAFGTPERLLGKLAHAAGLTEDDEPRSAVQLVDTFSWNTVRAHHNDIVIDEAFFA